MHRHLAAAVLAALTAGSASGQAGFPTYSGILADMSAAAANYPAICEFVDLTTHYGMPMTPNGNALYAVRISDNVAVEEDEPAFLMVSAHHGNEYGTPIVALDAIARLTQGYGVDPTITALVDEYEIWIAPCWNPDGYSTSRNNANGVDLNRNYPFLWASACNTGLRGPSPGSEVETQTMIALSEDQRFTKVLDYHSSGREVLFGYVPGCGQHVFGSYLQSEAVALSSASSYSGQNRGPSSNGEHYQWQLGEFSNYAFLTEISTTQSPTRASADAEAQRLWPGTVWMLQRPIPVWGRVTDAVTGQPLEANITYVENPFTQGERNRSEPLHGRYHAFLPPGNHTLRFERAGYVTQDVPVTVTAGGSVLVDVPLVQPILRFSYPVGLPSSVDPAGGTTIRVDVAAGTQVPQADSGEVTVVSANGTRVLAMTEVMPNAYEVTLPGFACEDTVELRFSAEDLNGARQLSAAVFLPTALQVQVNSSNAFEVASGWVGGQPGDTATTGQWNRMDPVATAAQPGDDHTPAGTQCWVTDGRGGSLGTYDVDNGFTTLLSAPFDLSALPEARIRYWRWFSNNQGSTTNDVFRVDVSGDNGATWTNVETIGVNDPQASGGWFQHSFRVADLVVPSAQVRLRFIAEDINQGSIVEAAVDDVEVFVTFCDGEVERWGSGCADSSGAVLRLQQFGQLHLGESVSFGLERGVSLPGFLLLGFDDQSFNGQPLPAPVPGTAGCTLQVQPDETVGLIPTAGVWQTTVANSPALIGLDFYWQAIIVDPSLATTLQMAFSDSLRTQLGS